MINQSLGSFSRLKYGSDYAPSSEQTTSDDVYLNSGSHPSCVLQMSSSPSTAGGGVNLDKFFADVESIREELKDMENIHHKLQDYHEQCQKLENSAAVIDIRTKLEADVSVTIKKAKLVVVRIEVLERSIAANRGSGTRTSILTGLRKKHQDSMDSYTSLRQIISSESRETIQRRYLAVIGEHPNVLDVTGESKSFLEKAISAQGRGKMTVTVKELEERQAMAKEMESKLKQLHLVFLPTVVMEQSRLNQPDDLEGQVARAKPFTSYQTQAKGKISGQKQAPRSRSSFYYAIIICLVILLVMTVAILHLTRSNCSANKPLQPPMKQTIMRQGVCARFRYSIL